jgi:hypothetical protein
MVLYQLITQKIYLVLRISRSIMALDVFNAMLLTIFLIIQQRHAQHALINTNSMKQRTNAIN